MKLKIIEISRVEGVEDEVTVRDHFLSLGYKVIRGSDYDPTFDLYGAPDFYVEKDGRGFFVEVKSWAGSLELHQLKWMLKHSDREFKLAVVPPGFFEGPDREISIEREKS